MPNLNIKNSKLDEVELLLPSMDNDNNNSKLVVVNLSPTHTQNSPRRPYRCFLRHASVKGKITRTKRIHNNIKLATALYHTASQLQDSPVAAPVILREDPYPDYFLISPLLSALTLFEFYWIKWNQGGNTVNAEPPSQSGVADKG
ncbi:hypothetical protein Tco_1113688 [Tanacetum coccineum]|uniref:Uncharacterized protein n=1 Tax=Tanacetum coccineum TaxID=301880 RepID=A0ABQ5IUD2_9ASTR